MASAWTPGPRRWCQSFLAYWDAEHGRGRVVAALERLQRNAVYALARMVEKSVIDHQQGRGRILFLAFGPPVAGGPQARH